MPKVTLGKYLLLKSCHEFQTLLERENGFPWPIFRTSEQQENLRSTRNLSKRGGGRLRRMGAGGLDDSTYITGKVHYGL